MRDTKPREEGRGRRLGEEVFGVDDAAGARRARRGEPGGARLCKGQKVDGAVALGVKLGGRRELHVVLHRGRVLDAHEVVVPHAAARHEEEAEEALRQQHLRAKDTVMMTAAPGAQ